jgi:hypothetical protein
LGFLKADWHGIIPQETFLILVSVFEEISSTSREYFFEKKERVLRVFLCFAGGFVCFYVFWEGAFCEGSKPAKGQSGATQRRWRKCKIQRSKNQVRGDPV